MYVYVCVPAHGWGALAVPARRGRSGRRRRRRGRAPRRSRWPAAGRRGGRARRRRARRRRRRRRPRAPCARGASARAGMRGWGWGCGLADEMALGMDNLGRIECLRGFGVGAPSVGLQAPSPDGGLLPERLACGGGAPRSAHHAAPCEEKSVIDPASPCLRFLRLKPSKVETRDSVSKANATINIPSNLE